MKKMLLICVLSAALVIALAQTEVPRCKWSSEANLGSLFVFLEADKCLDLNACTIFTIVLCCGETENVMEKYSGASTKHTLEAQATCNDRSPSALQVQHREVDCISDTKSIDDSGRHILRGTAEQIRASGSSCMLTAITGASLAGVALLAIAIFLATLILCCRWSRGTREKMPIQCSEE